MESLHPAVIAGAVAHCDHNAVYLAVNSDINDSKTHRNSLDSHVSIRNARLGNTGIGNHYAVNECLTIYKEACKVYDGALARSDIYVRQTHFTATLLNGIQQACGIHKPSHLAFIF